MTQAARQDFILAALWSLHLNNYDFLFTVAHIRLCLWVS